MFSPEGCFDDARRHPVYSDAQGSRKGSERADEAVHGVFSRYIDWRVQVRILPRDTAYDHNSLRILQAYFRLPLWRVQEVRNGELCTPDRVRDVDV